MDNVDAKCDIELHRTNESPYVAIYIIINISILSKNGTGKTYIVQPILFVPRMIL